MRFSTSNLYKGRSIPKNTDIQTHTRQCLYICLGIHEKYTHTHWGASFFSFFIFNTYVYVFISLHRSVNVVWIFLFCLLIMEHQETIWSHMEKSEFPFNSFVWLAILVLYSLLLLPLHIYSVSIQNSNSAHWVHVIQTHGFFMFVFVCVCVFMLFFLFIWTTKKSLVWNSSWIMSRQWCWWWLWPRPHLYLCFTRFEPCFCDSVFRVFFQLQKKNDVKFPTYPQTLMIRSSMVNLYY